MKKRPEPLSRFLGAAPCVYCKIGVVHLYRKGSRNEAGR